MDASSRIDTAAVEAVDDRLLPTAVGSEPIRQIQFVESGKRIAVPSTRIFRQSVIVTGRWLQIARIQDEERIEGRCVENPKEFTQALSKSGLPADIFTFAQKIWESVPNYPYHFEQDNVAAIPITTYEDWFQKRIGNDVKQNVKKSGKRGLVVQCVPFNDGLVRDIMVVFNETPVRQGRLFWHYGKNFDTVKRETSDRLNRSIFIGAYFKNELVGFVKLLRTGCIADIVLFVCKEEHRDKKAANALIAKSVDVCVRDGIRFLTYAQFFYQKKSSSSLAEFKRRNGFEPIWFPRYYIALTARGSLGLKLNLHHGIKGILPERVVDALRAIRSRVLAAAESRQ